MLTVFMTLFLVELPDKTFIATLVLATKYRPLYVWIGVAAAFLVQTLVAVVFGRLLTFLPEKPVHAVVAVLFLVAGVVLIKGAKDAKAEGDEAEEEFSGKASKPAEGLKAISASFLILFLAEWGDLSQLATAGFVARGGNPWAVGVAAFAALALVSGLGAAAGRALLQRISLSAIRAAGGVVCLLFAALMIAGLAGVEFPSWVPA